MVPPMSTTTTSPGWMTRSETSWCGEAAFGPEPTITKSALMWPSAKMASAILTPTWRSVCPALSQCGTLACTRSIASPASLSAATSAGVLRIRSGDRTSEASRWPAPGQGLRELEHVQRPHPVAQGDQRAGRRSCA